MAIKEMERVNVLEPKKTKRVSISSKRQISIPKEFYDALDLGRDVNIELYHNRLVIKPGNDNSEDFSGEILQDLIDEGYAGNELVQEFNFRKSQIPNAIKSLIDEAVENSKPTSVNDLFGENT